MKEEQKNLIIFVALAAFILFAWEPVMRWIAPGLFPKPQAQVQTVATPKPGAAPSAPADADPTADGAKASRDRKAVLAETPRVQIDTPTLKGSINLKGARIDDLVLTQYAETVAKGSQPIRLLSPAGAPQSYFAGFGWSGTNVPAPDANTVWTASAPRLTPGHPVVLSATKGSLNYRITLSVDDKYMFTVQQQVGNAGAAPVQISPYAYISRAEKSPDPDQWTANVGPIVDHDGGTNYLNWSDVPAGEQTFANKGGWLGFTDHYWLTALVPGQASSNTLSFRSRGESAFQANLTPASATLLPADKTLTTSTRFFAGAKEVNLLNTYEKQGGIPRFGRAIDWGWFETLEEPIFHYLHWLYRMIGNFGIAIICLTLTIRGFLFPIAQRQFKSMAQMRAVQPKMKALQEKHKEDKTKLQEEMMKLYREEKVNPLGGCAPTLLQIPIMFALYKVLILTIEMRHKPFILWIHDLSAPDPLTPVNLFGLLPFDPPGFLHIGIVPILLGISMYYQFKLNPAPMDETQKQVFAIMPWMMMFLMAPFAVGLQIYWITSNIITIAQQQFLYSRHPALKDKPAT